jgi:hypothetical protein
VMFVILIFFLSLILSLTGRFDLRFNELTQKAPEKGLIYLR